MMIASGDIDEYKQLNSLSIEDYLIRFKMFIDKIETNQKENDKIKAQNLKGKR